MLKRKTLFRDMRHEAP